MTWTNIPNAVDSIYTPVGDDVGLRLRVTVVATNATGSGSASSAASGPVLSPPPTNSSPPAVTGDAVEGSTLLTSTGEWLGNPLAYDYEWQRCGEAGCTEIRFEVDPEYTLRDDDVGFTVQVVVTASNLAGSASATSAQTASVLPHAPANEEPPEIDGVASQGETLTASTGDWHSSDPEPVTYAYQWQRSANSGATWAGVPGADEDGYRLDRSRRRVHLPGRGDSVERGRLDGLRPSPPPR